jgi:predicted esterase
MRSLVAVCLFAAVAALVAVSEPAPVSAQDKKKDDKKKVDPKSFLPTADQLKTIKDKTEELRKAIAALKAKKLTDDVLIEVEVYLKAAENIVRFEEWLAAASVKWALSTLDAGLSRAKQAEGGKPVWRDAPGKWVVRAYRSQIDNSIQPYAVLLPHDYGADPKKKWRLDVVLHGRDGSLTESKFIATHAGAAPKDLGYLQLEVYGRGNNAYRWAGETDVFEAIGEYRGASQSVDPYRIVLRGFSMGGAGTWHIGLHHPSRFAVIGPGAGFTTTHGYIANLPKELPEHQEKCLRIYDAYLHAENAFNVPVIAYSGEKDAQKKAADNIENALKAFKEPHVFKHVVAPGLEHAQPKEWQVKLEGDYKKYAEKGRAPFPERVRFVTHTSKYAQCGWAAADALETSYERATIEGTRKAGAFDVRTTNVRRLLLLGDTEQKAAPRVTLDGQTVAVDGTSPVLLFEKGDGKWAQIPFASSVARTFPGIKEKVRTGPIDDAFTTGFVTVPPTGGGFPAAAHKQFAAVWDRYFRGALPTADGATAENAKGANLVLFGTPQTNPLVAKALPKLPIKWTAEKLEVNGVEYDAKTHLPVLIYPNPLNPTKYIVINSGHTFGEADLKGTNALLYPRLGDWAVIKPTPTAKDPAAYEVVAAGLFDENWQFPKKK